MAKTKPIGVRFDESLLEALKNSSIADSPQKALNLYERSYVELIEMKVKQNNQPEKKHEIEQLRQATPEPKIEKAGQQPLTDHSSEITALKAEMAALGNSSLANQRKKYLEKQIKRLQDTQ